MIKNGFTPIRVIFLVLTLIVVLFLLAPDKKGNTRFEKLVKNILNINNIDKPDKTEDDTDEDGEPIDTRDGVALDLCDEAEISCTELGSLWSGGKAKCREDGNGYDVSSCTRAQTLTNYEVVKPAERDSSRWKTARCNDGSPFTYEVQLSSSGSNEWVIYLEGGGFCDDNANSCTTRPITHYSTLRDEKTHEIVPDGELISLKKGGIFGTNSSENPTFHNANKVFAEYCSSDAWSGATTERRPSSGDRVNGWYFSGQANVRSIFESLMQRYGLDDSNNKTKVLFTGGSAGGGGVTTNSYKMPNLLPNASADGRVKILSDAGMMPEFDDPDYRPGDATVGIPELALYIYDFFGVKFNPDCEEDQRRAGEDAANCYFISTYYPYITKEPPEGLGLPFMLQSSSIDSFALDLHGITDPVRDAEAIEKWQEVHFKETKDVEWLFSGSEKPYHTILTKDGPQGWDMGPKGQTFKEVVTRFWEGGSPIRVIF